MLPLSMCLFSLLDFSETVALARKELFQHSLLSIANTHSTSQSSHSDFSREDTPPSGIQVQRLVPPEISDHISHACIFPHIIHAHLVKQLRGRLMRHIISKSPENWRSSLHLLKDVINAMRKRCAISPALTDIGGTKQYLTSVRNSQSYGKVRQYTVTAYSIIPVQ